MIQKLALRVCPLPGCPKIGLQQGSRCPAHDKLMVREIYVHQQPRDPKLQSSLDSIKDPKLKETFERTMRNLGM